MHLPIYSIGPDSAIDDSGNALAKIRPFMGGKLQEGKQRKKSSENVKNQFAFVFRKQPCQNLLYLQIEIDIFIKIIVNRVPLNESFIQAVFRPMLIDRLLTLCCGLVEKIFVERYLVQIGTQIKYSWRDIVADWLRAKVPNQLEVHSQSKSPWKVVEMNSNFFLTFTIFGVLRSF